MGRVTGDSLKDPLFSFAVPLLHTVSPIVIPFHTHTFQFILVPFPLFLDCPRPSLPVVLHSLPG